MASVSAVVMVGGVIAAAFVLAQYSGPAWVEDFKAALNELLRPAKLETNVQEADKDSRERLTAEHEGVAELLFSVGADAPDDDLV